MGFTAIWISPVPRIATLIQIVKNIPDDWTAGSGESYHGYWAQDIYSLNPHFGNETDLLALSDALHARNMLLMVDVAPNHMGSGPVSKLNYEELVPWNDARYFHPPRLGIQYEPPDQTQIEQYWIGVDRVALPDVNTELPEVYNTLSQWIRELVKRYGIDGLRLDTVKHIRKNFWPGFCRASSVFGVGEVLSGDAEYITYSC
jgi:alpha-amylase